MNFILLINFKMPTIVGILTFTSRINTTSECFKQETIFIFQYFTLMSTLNFMLSWVKHGKTFITLGPACIPAVLPEPSLHTHTKYGSTLTIRFRPNTRQLAP